jgi:hypothetical protein
VMLHNLSPISGVKDQVGTDRLRLLHRCEIPGRD